MKFLLILLIKGYQKFLSGLLGQVVGVPRACRFDPTCSEYAKSVIEKKGIIIGGYLAFIRIIKCQPFYNPKVSKLSNRGVGI